jgi:hypothetical protein
MRSSWSRATRRRALGGAAVAALGTVLLAAPIASAAEGPTTTSGSTPTVTQPAGNTDPALTALRGDDAFTVEDSTIIICDRCQVAKGDIINVGKIIINHHHKHKKQDDKGGK